MFHPSSSSAPNCRDLSMHHAASFSSAALPTAPTEIPRSSFLHDNGGLIALTNAAASAPPPYYIPRTAISQFLPLHLQLPDPVTSNATFSCSSPPACQFPLPHIPSSPSSSSGDLLEFSAGAMRRVFSTGDLQAMNVSPPPPAAAGETYSQDAGGPFTQKVGRYSAEERKEKIDRYRIKRHQRNFHKKITYACRKTLADSRPRVQGRFARNAETETEAEAAADLGQGASADSYEHCNYSSFTNNSLCRASDESTTWRWETPIEAAAAYGHHQYQHPQQLLGFDMDVDEDELWASLADMCSGTLPGLRLSSVP